MPFRRGFDSRHLHSITQQSKTIYKKYPNKKYQPRTRVNHWIKISPIHLIDEQGNNLGITETSKALKMAREQGLDLIEIAPNAKPPVCRIMDYGKYKYQKSKKEKTQKIKQKSDELKGIRISFRTGQHDLEIKAKRAEKFLEQGHKVKIEMILRGREKSFSLAELAKEKFNQFIESINLEIKIEQEMKKQPRGLLMVISKAKK